MSGWEARIPEKPVGGEALRPSATSDVAPSNPQRASYSTGSLQEPSQLVGTYSSLHIPTRPVPPADPRHCPSHSPFLLGNLARCRSPASVVLLFLLHIAIANSNTRPHRHCSWRPFHFSPAPLVFVSSARVIAHPSLISARRFRHQHKHTVVDVTTLAFSSPSPQFAHFFARSKFTSNPHNEVFLGERHCRIAYRLGRLGPRPVQHRFRLCESCPPTTRNLLTPHHS